MSNSKMKRDIHGVILLDKPQGMSSNRALQKVKAKLQAKKAGHTGSLDPLATGLLPICLGQATKASEYALGADKSYSAVIRLGQETDSYDAQGTIVKERDVNVSDAEIDAVVQSFLGDILQVPPMYSALKKSGQPLYKLARAGKSIQLEARPMTAHSLTWQRIDAVHISIETTVSSGFYIRSLAHDIGQALGCGAHITALRRLSIRDIQLAQAVDLPTLESSDTPEQYVLPIECLLAHLPKIIVTQEQYVAISQGQKAYANHTQKSDALHRLYLASGQLIGVGAFTPEGEIKSKKQFIV